MLHYATQLHTTIDGFQVNQPQGTSCDDTYSAALDRTTAEYWEDVRQYLRLLGSFVEAALHLGGNVEPDEYEGNRRLL